MPYIVVGEPSSWKNIDYKKRDFQEYIPRYNGLNLKPGTPLHDWLRGQIWNRASEARNEISKRFDSWRAMDKKLTTYIPLKDAEETLQLKDENKPVSIVFPYTYSMLEALLTYLWLAFIQDPIFPYEGVDDSDMTGAMLLEKVVDLHCHKTKVALNLHTMFRDALVYGVGPVIPEWVKRYGKKPVRSMTGTASPLGMSTNPNIQMVDSLLFEGNAISNIDPYMWLTDPSVSSSEIQKGEFTGWIDRTNYMNLLAEEQYDTDLFNVKYLATEGKTTRRSQFALDQSDRQTKFGGAADIHRNLAASLNPVDRIRMYITIIPNQWGPSDTDDRLGSSSYPEKWYFELAADDIIISAHNAEYNHGMYPLAVASPEFDGYSITPISRMEILYGLQHTLDFLFNSHVANVRKAINDMLVVDPYLVNIEDLKDPKPGKLIRLRRPAWGRGVDKVVQQLAVQDITRLNISDSAYITQWMDRIAGADQPMQGSLRMGGPERLTAAEFQGTRGSAVSRLQRIAMIIGMQAMQDIGTMFACHTQQYMSQETYIKIAGNYQEELMQLFPGKKNAPVSPYDLAVSYDIIARDGSIPGNNITDAWIEMFKIIAQTPELATKFDIGKLFMFIAQQSGAKNAREFIRATSNVQPQVLPDQVVANEAQKGNLVPLQEVVNG